MPQAADLHHIGTRATVHKVVKMPNQSLFVFTEGNERVRLGEFAQITPVHDRGVRDGGGD
jgi:ATP-dependent Lon protease